MERKGASSQFAKHAVDDLAKACQDEVDEEEARLVASNHWASDCGGMWLCRLCPWRAFLEKRKNIVVRTYQNLNRKIL